MAPIYLSAAIHTLHIYINVIELIVGNILFYVLQSKYEDTDTNTLFSSVLHQITNVPKEYKPAHLRLQLVRSIIVTRVSLKTIIKDDLMRYGITYKQFADELADVTGPFPLKPAIRSPRLLLVIPMAVYRAYPSQKHGRGRKKDFTVKVWYPFQADKDLDVNFKFINLVNNG